MVTQEEIKRLVFLLEVNRRLEPSEMREIKRISRALYAEKTDEEMSKILGLPLSSIKYLRKEYETKTDDELGEEL